MFLRIIKIRIDAYNSIDTSLIPYSRITNV